jgi:hypothetical protein
MLPSLLPSRQWQHSSLERPLEGHTALKKEDAMNTVKYLLTALLLVSCLIADEPAPGKAQAWVKVESLNPVAVKGEPIYFRTTKYGTPYAGDLYLNGRLCQRPQPDMGDRPSPTPGEKNATPVVPQFNPTERTSVGPLSNNCDLRLKDMESREYELCYEDPWVKGCTKYRLVEPVGEDAKAYARMNKEACDYSESSFSGLSPQEIIKEYPTSVYAAWTAPSPGGDLQYVGGKALIEDMLKPVAERKRWGTFVENDNGKKYPKTKDGKYFIKSAEIEAQEFLNYADAFMPSHSDHPNAGLIYARLSLAYMVLHRWQDAFMAAKKSLELPWGAWAYSSYLPRLEIEKSVLQEAKNELVKRGLAKDK